MSNYTCYDGWFCTSLYGRLIRSSIDSVAMACSMDSNCKAFWYKQKTNFGFMCKEIDRIKTPLVHENGFEVWQIFEFDSGKVV